MSSAVLCICIVVLVPTLDHLSKYLVRTFMDVGDSIPIIKDFFHLTYILNDGMAFGSMGGKWRWVFMTVTPIALIAVAAYLIIHFKKLDKLTAASLSMIFAGGLSNMVDRIFFIHLDESSSGLFDGRVIDFFDFRGIWNAVFNVADSFVTIGVFLFMGAYIYGAVKEYRQAKKSTSANGSPAEFAATPQETEGAAAAPPEKELPQSSCRDKQPQADDKDSSGKP